MPERQCLSALCKICSDLPPPYMTPQASGVQSGSLAKATMQVGTCQLLVQITFATRFCSFASQPAGWIVISGKHFACQCAFECLQRSATAESEAIFTVRSKASCIQRMQVLNATGLSVLLSTTHIKAAAAQANIVHKPLKPVWQFAGRELCLVTTIERQLPGNNTPTSKLHYAARLPDT